MKLELTRLNSTIKLKKKIILKVKEINKLFLCDNKKLGVHCYSDSLSNLKFEIKKSLLNTYYAFNNMQDCQLSKYGLKIKKRLNKIIKNNA